MAYETNVDKNGTRAIGGPLNVTPETGLSHLDDAAWEAPSQAT